MFAGKPLRLDSLGDILYVLPSYVEVGLLITPQRFYRHTDLRLEDEVQGTLKLSEVQEPF